MSNFKDKQRKDLERTIQTQVKILNNSCEPYNLRQLRLNALIDYQNYYKDKYGTYYRVPERL